jgi:hypothetical protein
VAAQFRARFRGDGGILFLGKAQEKAPSLSHGTPTESADWRIVCLARGRRRTGSRREQGTGSAAAVPSSYRSPSLSASSRPIESQRPYHKRTLTDVELGAREDTRRLRYLSPIACTRS